jgi:hypothetical protein
MTARGRPAGFVMDDSHRVKIQNSNILTALIKHVEGRQEMTASQVSAGLGLLRKIMPDLQQTALTDADGNALTINVSIGGDAPARD